jgi:predicted ester cyclase
MTTQEYIQLLNRYIDAIWVQKDLSQLNTFLSPNYIRHQSPTKPPLTRSDQALLLQNFQAAFPDAELTVEKIFAENGRIAFRSTLRATHQGQFLDLKPTGKQITVTLIDIIHIQNNQFVEQWGGPNMYDLLTQLKAQESPPKN